MKTSFFHTHDPLGWSFETFREPAAWFRPINRSRLGQPRIARAMRGGIVGAGALLVAMLAIQPIPHAQLANVTAAWLAAGGLILVAAAFDAIRSHGIAGLLAAGLATSAMTFVSDSTGAWLAASALAASLGGVLGTRTTRFAGLFTGWAWFHGLLAAALAISQPF